jgi:NTP pyrophosphatase (non-canonical NTP hydrolase)
MRASPDTFSKKPTNLSPQPWRKDLGKIKEELGDLLLEVGLYCQIAKERGDFLPTRRAPRDNGETREATSLTFLETRR